jgi:hypothetical protein
MRMAGRFSRRLRAWAQAHHIPVSGLSSRRRQTRDRATVFEHAPGASGSVSDPGGAFPSGGVGRVPMSRTGKIGNIAKKDPWPYVNHDHFHLK